ncbi:Myocyte-specific enhancer factor 2 [Talaromyces islandicus]|uniref:Myocyte-specific enhancer factor 2 n=1 Tax=Talaromyces islandicus TaxID=28573 RepID=A0A0U1LZR9_TALIS|nr:Myocyte-specific enhancer factor 2 [Talaromyces islandicus]
MGRRKIEIKPIRDDRNRSVTFLKRKSGLFKKAHELSVLCSVDVAVIIFGHNKKLYEFSSGDIRETITKYHHYGAPHEHKGPHDFTGKGGDDDEDEDDEIAAEELGPPSQSMIPPQLQNQPGYQHMSHAPSASPPIPNGVAFGPRHGTPQPQGASRPSSRNHIRQVSSYGTHPAHATPPPPAHNGYTYMSNPSVYNSNANPPNLHNQPPRQSQYQQFAHPAHPHQQAPQHHGLPSHQNQTMHHQYMQDQQGRQSLPPDSQSYQHRPSLALPDPQQVADGKGDGSQSPKTKARSIFTPIDDKTSVFSSHFFGGSALRESPQRDTAGKQTQAPSVTASQTLPLPTASAPPPLSRAATEPKRSQSASSLTDSQQPSRPKPRLKVQIPSEQSDGSATADSSPRDSSGQGESTPAKKNSDAGPSGVVQLPPPPPSPGAGPLLSAGAQGPPNPFARPTQPASNSQSGAGFTNNQNMETPISALPSRFVSDALLPSPSSFFPEWGFSRNGPDTNMLPSPLTFPTPAAQSGPGFARDEDSDKKRKNSDGEASADGGKKVKT